MLYCFREVLTYSPYSRKLKVNCIPPDLTLSSCLFAQRQSIRLKRAAGGQSVPTSSNTDAIAGCSTLTGPEDEPEDCNCNNQEERSSPGF